MREHQIVVACEHPGCTARLTLTGDQLAYDSETDLLRYAGWTSIHGSEDRCPTHQGDLTDPAHVDLCVSFGGPNL